MTKMSRCNCGSGNESYWEVDGYGIPLCKVCPSCKAEQMKRYRKDINDQYDAEEPISDDEWTNNLPNQSDYL